MKIEPDKSQAPTGQTESAGATAPAASTPGGSRAAGSAQAGDQLTLSQAAQLLKEAQDAASAGPAVRSDLVARMRALLAEGKIGDDAARLADAIIDDVLNNG
jgi:flagellar biosynthesis anti-sigma factor FlgM